MKRLLHWRISPLTPRRGARRAEAHWRSFIQNTPDLILELDTTCIVRRANRPPPGYTLEQIVAHPITNLIPQPYQEAKHRAFQQARDSQTAAHFEYGDEAGRWYAALVSPIVDHDVVTAYIMSIRDVTEARKAHEAQRESEARFRNIVERVPVGMHMYELSPDGRLLFAGANPAADTILNMDHRQFIGKTIEEAFPGLVETEIPAVYRRLAAAGGVWKTEQFVYEHGSIRGIYEINAFQTAPGRVATTFMDITERRLALAALERSEERFRLLVDHSPAGVFLVDDAFRLVYVNDEICRITEYAPEELIGMDFRNLLADHQRDFIAERYLSRQRGEPQPWRYELQVISRSGLIKQIEMAIAVVRDSAGNLCSMGQVMDLSDRFRAEQHRVELAVEKERLDRMRTFISNVSHDLKTPVTVIQTSLFLIERYTDPQRRLEKIQLIREQINLLSRMIQDLLMISRLDYLPELNRDTVDVNDLIHQVEEQFHALVEKKHLHLSLHLDPDLPPLSADREALGRALTNLIENAVNYTPEGRSIHVHTQRQDTVVAMTIADEGMGIQPDDLPHIFNRYFRSQQAREIVNTGSGLGLTIVHRVVEMHGGRVEVDSTPGVGSTFRLVLPLASA